ncbi:MAG: FHA domain-containing protein [Anaerolineae bacterium]|nr:FHA domain-containing protein [Anaerolineae bacterium]
MNRESPSYRTLVVLCLCACVAVFLTAQLGAAAAPPPQEPIEVDVVTLVERINSWHLSAFRGYQFNKYIALGDIVRFNERIADGDVQVYIDPVQIAKRDAAALYEDCVGPACSTYFNDIVLGDTPDKVPAQTLWHEAMHAIFDEHDSELLVDNDEIYAWYMEGVINLPLQALTKYEEEWRKGKDCDQERLDRYWSTFEQRLQDARNTVEGPITSDAQIEQLRQLTGFRVNAAAIRQGYIEAGMDKCTTTATAPTPSTSSATLSDLDLVFCIDVTGSMSDDIASVKAAAASIVNTIAAKNKNYRVAILAYRDWDDTLPMFEDYGFSTSKEAIISNINSLSVGGGGDEPEAVFEALMRAIDSTAIGSWRPNVNKQIILMGDAPPHNPSREGLTPTIVAKAAEDADPVVIQALVVGNEGVYSEEAAAAFRELADLTGGNFFEAADASKVPEMLQRTIEVIESPKSSGLLSTRNLIIAGVLCLVAFGFVVVVLLVILIFRKRSRPAPQPGYPGAVMQPPPPYAPPPAGPQYGGGPPPQAPGPQAPYPPPAHWQGQTVVGQGMGGPELVVEAGRNVGSRLAVGSYTRIGRAADNDVVLGDPKASRYHAVITASASGYVITDQGSANGTLVNGVPIQQPCPLYQGDVISIGSEQMRFQQR